MREMHIQANDANQRVDKFISKAVPLLPKTLMYKYIRNKKIKVNHKRCEIAQRLVEGDVVTFYMAEEFFNDAIDLSFLQCKLNVVPVYEDEHLMLVCKAVGESVQPDEKFPLDNVVNAVKKYLYQTKQYDPHHEKSFTPAVVNRLDRNTEGLVIAAKSAQAARELSEIISKHKLDKYYQAIVEGSLKPKHNRLVAWHRKDEAKRIALVRSYPEEGYKEMESEYWVLQQKPGYTLVEVLLKTGRFHQIRAQFAHLKHPLVGDAKYGAKIKWSDGQALCAYKIHFHADLGGTLHYLSDQTFQLEQSEIQKTFDTL